MTGGEGKSEREGVREEGGEVNSKVGEGKEGVV
jgi:hypothetical protein